MYRTAREGAHVGAMVFAGIAGLLVVLMITCRASDTPSRAAPAPTVKPTAAATAKVPVPKPSEIDSAWLEQSPAAAISVGGEAILTFRFKNTGRAAWARGQETEASLAFTGDSTRFDPRMAVGWPLADRAAIQAEELVQPGGVATFTFKVKGVTPGTFRIDVRPVIVAVGWLRDEGVYTEVTVR